LVEVFFFEAVVFGVVLAAEGFELDFLAGAESVVDSEDELLSSLVETSAAVSVLEVGESTPVRSVRLLSVTYQPEPLNRMGGAFSSR
jgi:hypothetical protein